MLHGRQSCHDNGVTFLLAVVQLQMVEHQLGKELAEERMGREKLREEFTLLEQDFRQVTTQKLELLQVLTNKVGMPFIICIQCLRCIYLTYMNQCCMFYDYITLVAIMIFFSYHHHHSSLCSRNVPWLGDGASA